MPKERRIAWMITYHKSEDEPTLHPDELEPDSMDRPDVEHEFMERVRYKKNQRKGIPTRANGGKGAEMKREICELGNFFFPDRRA